MDSVARDRPATCAREGTSASRHGARMQPGHPANQYEIRTAVDCGVTYGQFCSIARTLDVLGERWTLLVVRELLCGSSRFNDIQRGIPRISRTMLSARLRSLADAGAITRRKAGYELTAAGRELAPLVEALGVWGQRWLPHQLTRDELDPLPLLWDIRRRVDHAALPDHPIVVRFELADRHRSYLLLRRSEASLCTSNPGYPELIVRASTAALAAWWRGDTSFARAGIHVDGPRALARQFPRWFLRYALASVAAA
jgi:DNA-binding HxlR family transcriptional regulator